MTRNFVQAPQSADLASLADSAVIALGLFIRTGQKSIQQLKQGITLCEEILRCAADAGEAENVAAGESPRRKQLRATAIPDTFADKEAVTQVTQARDTLQRIIDEDAKFPESELSGIQEMFIEYTMPAWRKRHTEFRERKLKRRLKRYG